MTNATLTALKGLYNECSGKPRSNMLQILMPQAKEAIAQAEAAAVNKLFFIAATDENGESRDAFVVAPDAMTARDLWRDAGDGDCDDLPSRVFELPAQPHDGRPRVLSWFDEAQEVSPRLALIVA